MHVLLIEPDRLQTMVYVAALKRAGHTVDHTPSAQAAIQLIDESVPDVVVLELQLPGHNGVEFLYEFRSYPEWLAVPVIAHTFVSSQELARAATLKRQLGVKRILYKPVTTLAGLCEAIEYVAAVC